jgi:hypothetical protein
LAIKGQRELTSVFNKNQKEYPKNSDGKQFCMKFFIRGVCSKFAHDLIPCQKKKRRPLIPLLENLEKAQVSWIFNEGQ